MLRMVLRRKNRKPTWCLMHIWTHSGTRDIQTTIKDYVWNTISQNLFLLKQYPEYIFNFEGAVKYAWMKEYYPAQYEMKKFIESGRWHISGASWDATDTLVRFHKSAIRNIMLGQVITGRIRCGEHGHFLAGLFRFWLDTSCHCVPIADWSASPPRSCSGATNRSTVTTNILSLSVYGKVWTALPSWWLMDMIITSVWGRGPVGKQGLVGIDRTTPLHMVYRYYGTGDIGGSPTLESVRAVEKACKAMVRCRLSVPRVTGYIKTSSLTQAIRNCPSSTVNCWWMFTVPDVILPRLPWSCTTVRMSFWGMQRNAIPL